MEPPNFELAEYLSLIVWILVSPFAQKKNGNLS